VIQSIISDTFAVTEKNSLNFVFISEKILKGVLKNYLWARGTPHW
jgi:hypothetical protein